MLVYPQLVTGALSQFPLQKRRQFRTLVNTAQDGSVVKLGDAGAGTIEWQLTYNALSDAELDSLMQFIVAAEGTLNSFTFVDPLDNLLAWSNDLDNAVWDRAPFICVTGGVADPLSGEDAWHIANSGSAAQALSQTVMAPGGYLYTFSVYAKSAATVTATLLLGGNRHDQVLGPSWRRIACSNTGDSTALSVTFGIEIGPGAAIDVYGLQVEPQASPSAYKPSTSGGCYENARLSDDTLLFTTTGVNRHSATVNIIYANHL